MRNRTTRAAHTIPSQEDNLMLARLRKAQENNEGGFTLIELLVVMIIIGILAAIAIPAFLNQKAKAKETAAKSDATNISKELAAALVDGPFVEAPTIAQTASTTDAAENYVLSYKTTADSAVVPVNVKVSTGNIPTVTGAASYTTASGVYCVSVATADGTSWSAGPNGLKKGATCA